MRLGPLGPGQLVSLRIGRKGREVEDSLTNDTEMGEILRKGLTLSIQ